LTGTGRWRTTEWLEDRQWEPKAELAGAAYVAGREEEEVDQKLERSNGKGYM
jgi:hypothetical protein